MFINNKSEKKYYFFLSAAAILFLFLFSIFFSELPFIAYIILVILTIIVLTAIYKYQNATELLILFKWHSQIFILLFFSLIFILLILFYDHENKPLEPKQEALLIAYYHLSNLQSLPEFKGLKVSSINSLLKIDDDDLSIYDVKLVDDKNDSKGFIIVNLDRTEFPILFFTSNGPSVTELLKYKAGNKDINIYYLSPTFYVALDSTNKIVAKLGDYILDKKYYELVRNRRLNVKDYLNIVSLDYNEKNINDQVALNEEWEEIDIFLSEAGGKKTSELVKPTLPISNYYVYYAEGYERAPHFKQIDPHTGVNNTDNKSGCAATAWTTFIRWHDLLWTPEVLMGSQRYYGQYGLDSDPNHEPRDETYNDRVIMNLSKWLGTFGKTWDDVGYVWNLDMEKGFNFITDKLQNSISSKKYWTSHSTAVRKARKYIVEYQKPSIIKTPGHFCVLAGFIDNLNSESIDRQWLYILTGWTNPQTGYLKSKHLEKLWYTETIYPRTLSTINFIAKNGITLCNTRNDNYKIGLPPLWLFWLDQDYSINYMHGKLYGDYYNSLSAETKSNINIKAKYPPSACGDSEYVYLVYVDFNDKVHLIWYDEKYRRFQELPLPDIHSKVQPAIVGGIHNWLTIAFCDDENGMQILTTNKDIQRSFAWPDQIHISGIIDPSAQSYWFSIGSFDWKTNQKISMFRYDGYTILCWINTYNNNSSWWFFKPPNNGVSYTSHYLKSNLINELKSAPSFTIFNKIPLMTYKDFNDRIHIDNLTITPPQWFKKNPSLLGRSSDSVYEGRIGSVESARLKQTCITEPSIGNTGTQLISVAWQNVSGDMSFYLISIDNYNNPLSYRGQMPLDD